MDETDPGHFQIKSNLPLTAYYRTNICKIRETSESGGVQSAMTQHDGDGSRHWL